MAAFLGNHRLPHYLSIGENEAPFHEIAKGIQIPARDLCSLGIVDLWRLHEEGLEQYRTVSENRARSRKRTGNSSLIDVKIELAGRILESCHFCERRCQKNRKVGECGTCGVPGESFFASEFLHVGEESELIPSHTIFFSGCTFSCCYCQNWDIATNPRLGAIVRPEDIAVRIEERHAGGSKNANFVGGNPDPHLLTILRIINRVSVPVPMVWNSNMYCSLESMRLLDGAIDLYLADFRYGNNSCARKYSKVPAYFEIVSRNMRIAHDQTDVILRHLVLPGHVECCTKPVMEWVAHTIPDVYFNLMFQYYPCHEAHSYPEINRHLSGEERSRAEELAHRTGINVSVG